MVTWLRQQEYIVSSMETMAVVGQDQGDAANGYVVSQMVVWENVPESRRVTKETLDWHASMRLADIENHRKRIEELAGCRAAVFGGLDDWHGRMLFVPCGGRTMRNSTFCSRHLKRVSIPFREYWGSKDDDLAKDAPRLLHQKAASLQEVNELRTQCAMLEATLTALLGFLPANRRRTIQRALKRAKP